MSFIGKEILNEAAPEIVETTEESGPYNRRGPDNRFIPRDKESSGQSSDDKPHKLTRNQKFNKNLNKLDWDLKEEFSKRRLTIQNFLDFCKDFRPYSRPKVYKDLNERKWSEISLQDKIIYYLFFRYIDRSF